MYASAWSASARRAILTTAKKGLERPVIAMDASGASYRMSGFI
jgi:hypothetical protein